jgi:hypothetical protein
MSTKSVAEKLLIKPNATVWVSGSAPTAALGELPDGVTMAGSPAEAAVAVMFAVSAVELRTLLGRHGGALGTAATVWIAYPKGNRADINRDSLWPVVAEYGMRPIGQVAIDDVWSALRFRALTPGETPFSGGRR